MRMNFRYSLRNLSVFIGLLVLAGAFKPVTLSRAAVNAPLPPSVPFPIAASDQTWEGYPALAYDPDRQQYLVAYVTGSGNNAVAASCVDQTGSVLSTYALGFGWNPDAVYDPAHDQYVVVWRNDTTGDVDANYVAGSCCKLAGCTGTAFAVSADRPGDEYGAAIAYNKHDDHQDMLIVWYEDENLTDHRGVWGRRMDGTTLKGSSFPISNPSTSYNTEPDLAYNINRNEFLVVFTRDTTKTYMDGDIWGIRLWNGPDSTGGIIGGSEQAIDSSAYTQDHPQVAAYRLDANTPTPYLVVFRDRWNNSNGDIRGYMLNQEGAPVTLVNIAQETDVIKNFPQVHAYEPSGGDAVTWQEYDIATTRYETQWCRVDPSGVVGAVQPVYRGSGDSEAPVIVNSQPVPFAAYMTRMDTESNVYGVFLMETVFLPLALREM